MHQLGDYLVGGRRCSAISLHSIQLNYRPIFIATGQVLYHVFLSTVGLVFDETLHKLSSEPSTWNVKLLFVITIFCCYWHTKANLLLEKLLGIPL